MQHAVPVHLFSIWAKSGVGSGHSLLHHMLDVAAVVEAVLESEPASTLHWSSDALGLVPEQTRRWIATLCGLHDFGKAIPGFQTKWPDGKSNAQSQGFGFSAASTACNRHDLATAALLGKELYALCSLPPHWLQHVVRAVSAHHGYQFLPSEINHGKPLNESPEWPSARREILALYWQVLAPSGAPVLERLTLPPTNWLAGLTSVADWIASNPEWFELGDRGFDDLAEYYSHAGQLAQAALQAIGWFKYQRLLREALDTDAAIARIVNQPTVKARALQTVGDRLLTGVQGPALLLVEAPMGEGKTELAFLAHLRLQAANGHRGLYVALPTQATGNALFKRALTFLAQFATSTIDVQLVHGSANMNQDVRHLRDIDHSVSESLGASAWFSQRKRPLISPYGVGTIDQALYAVLNVKHHFVLQWGLSNRVVVLDEIHAYDTYTSGLIEALLRWLKALGCSVVLMSATLPAARRAALMAAWGCREDTLPVLAYPRVLVADQTGVRGEHFSSRPLAPIQIESVSEDLDAVVASVLRLGEQGGCGVVIVNTVERAQKLFACLRAQCDASVKVMLFHARFPVNERLAREQAVLDCFGLHGTRPERAILVATQVVEQSLDIDFDFMVTDLAPVDLLLQRAGRLHRHQRLRPTVHHHARLQIAGLHPDTPPDLAGTAWKYVYDAFVLFKTWALLKSEKTLQLPADIDRLVQAVYDDDTVLPADLAEHVRGMIEVESYGEFLARMQRQRALSFNIAINPDEDLNDAYARLPRGSEEGEGLGLENKTRLGRDSITLIPVEAIGECWCAAAGAEAFPCDRPVSDALARQLYNRHLKVYRFALVKHLQSTDVPVAFSHPLLRNCYPLLLVNGVARIGTLQVRLDCELGLIYESVGETEGVLSA